MDNKILMTVTEAAKFAGVSPSTIRYHINHSEKLYPILNGYGINVLVREVSELYPASDVGRKQKTYTVRKNRETTIREVGNMITDSAIKGDFHSVEFLTETLKLI